MKKCPTSLTVAAAAWLLAVCLPCHLAHSVEIIPGNSLGSQTQEPTVDNPDGQALTSEQAPQGSAPCEACDACSAFDDCDSCGGCRPCCNCGPPGRFWFRDEYVGWFAKPGFVPALLSTSADGSLPANEPIYGNSNYNGGYRSGNWTQGGMWFDCCKTWGIQGDYFFVGRKSSPFTAASNGDPILVRPFIDANTGAPSQEAISFPGVSVGSASVDNYNSLSGGGVSLRTNICCSGGCGSSCGDGGCGDGGDCGCACPCDYFCNIDCARLDFVFGYRGYRFNDNVNVRENLTSIDPGSGNAVGTQFDITDSFSTRNTFNGGEVGVIFDRYRGRWLWEGSGRLAIGGMHSVASINGSTVVSFPGQPTVVNQGGILALQSNIGTFTRNNWQAIPQLSLRLGYRITPRLSFLVGYTAIFFGQVERAGSAIDPVVNPNLIPPAVGGGADRPAFAFRTSDLWLQGITIGGELSF